MNWILHISPPLATKEEILKKMMRILLLTLRLELFWVGKGLGIDKIIES